MHDASASYYGAGPGGVRQRSNGHPGGKWGWAVSGGLRLNAPMIGPGDYFQGSGELRGRRHPVRLQHAGRGCTCCNGQSVGIIVHDDGGFTGTAAAPGIFELTTAFSVFASYEHFWTPACVRRCTVRIWTSRVRTL